MAWQHYWNRLYRDGVLRWRDCSRYKRIFIIAELAIVVDILLALLVASFLDSTRIIWHLVGFSVYIGFLSLITAYLSECITRRYEYFNGFHGKLKSQVAIFLASFSLNLIPFGSILKFSTNIICLSSAGFGLFQVFSKAYHGIIPALILLTSAVGLLAGALHWLPTLIIFVAMIPLIGLACLLQAENTFEMLGHDKNSSQESRGKKVLHSLSLSAVLVSSVSVSVYFCLLAADGFWIDSPEISKYDAIKTFKPTQNLHSLVVRSKRDLREQSHLFKLPVVIKPNVCTIGSKNVKVCRNISCLEDYIDQFLSGFLSEKHDQLSWLIQDYCPKQEAAIFYYRYPYFNHGKILNVGVRSPAKKSQKEELWHRYHPDEYIEASPALTRFFDRITSQIPSFTGGIIDVMMDSLEEAQKYGTGISVMEVNVFPLTNISENPTKNMGRWEGLKRSLLTNRTILMQLWFGAYNILSGSIRWPWRFILRLGRLYQRFELCDCEVRHFLAQP